MRTVSAEFLEISQRSEFHYLEYIVLDGQRIQISGKLMDDSYLDGNFIGTFIFKRLEFECEYHDFRNKEVSYHKAIRHQGEWQTVDFGNFIVTELEVSDTFDTVKVIAYDYGLKFASLYESALTYPTTLQAVLNEACEQVGMVAPTLDINGAFVVENNQFPEQQTRYVISAIAQITGNIAHIKGNQLVFVLNTPTGLVLDEYEELQDKRDTRPITIVSMGLSQVEGENITLRWEEGIAMYGENYLILNDNPFTYTQSKREEAITAVFNKMKGFSYSSFVIKNGFYPHLEIGDKVQFKTTNGSLVDSIVLRYEQAESVINLEAPSITKAIVNYQNPPSIEHLIKRTEIIVDKNSQLITAVSQKSDENADQLGQLTLDYEDFKTNYSKGYVTEDGMQAYVSTEIQQSADQISFTFQEALGTTEQKLSGDLAEYEQYVESFIRFVGGQIQLGNNASDFALVISNTGITINKGGSAVAYFLADKMLITKAEITQSLRIGNVAFMPEPNGSMSLRKV